MHTNTTNDSVRWGILGTGKIARVWPKVSVKGHADEVLAAAQAL